jgi:hypothetical protein
MCFFAIGNMLLGFSILTAIMEEKEFQQCLEIRPPIVEHGAWVYGGCGKFEEYVNAFFPLSIMVLPSGIWLLIYGYYIGAGGSLDAATRLPSLSSAVPTVGRTQFLKPNRVILALTIGIAITGVAISIFLLATDFLLDYYG